MEELYGVVTILNVMVDVPHYLLPEKVANGFWATSRGKCDARCELQTVLRESRNFSLVTELTVNDSPKCLTIVRQR